jgi:hypothetical protein
MREVSDGKMYGISLNCVILRASTQDTFSLPVWLAALHTVELEWPINDQLHGTILETILSCRLLKIN